VYDCDRVRTWPLLSVASKAQPWYNRRLCVRGPQFSRSRINKLLIAQGRARKECSTDVKRKRYRSRPCFATRTRLSRWVVLGMPSYSCAAASKGHKVMMLVLWSQLREFAYPPRGVDLVNGRCSRCCRCAASMQSSPANRKKKRCLYD
jgi:hypothetical protein